MTNKLDTKNLEPITTQPTKERQPNNPKLNLRVFNRYPLKKLVQVSHNMFFPGNFYLFRYLNFHHSPFPIIFYTGFNPMYNTYEGINLVYVPPAERIRIKNILISGGYIKGPFKIRDQFGEQRTYTKRGGDIYRRTKMIFRKDIIFYRRYKKHYIGPKIFLIPYETIDDILKINAPFKPFNLKELNMVTRTLRKI